MRGLETVVSLLGGARALREPRSLLDLAERVRAGLPAKSFETLAERLDVSESELADATGIPRRSLARRKIDGKLQRDESEAVLRVARVAGLAADVLGDLSAAHRWLRTENRALAGKTPLSLLDTEPGAELVRDVLERIEYGSYS